MTTEIETRLCEAPIKQGPKKGQSATGTKTGADRHYKGGEKPCDECREACRQSQSAYRKAHGPHPSPERPVGLWCKRRLHRMEGDNVYVAPGTRARRCRECMKETTKGLRRSSRCDYCGEWFSGDLFDLHRVWRGNQARCRTPDELRARGLVLWRIRSGDYSVWRRPRGRVSAR